MKYINIKDYIDGLENLKKIEITIEDDEEMSGSFYVTKTKETYVYEDESDADVKVDAVRRDVGFAGVEKKYKRGKMNKAGEVVRPETWTVVVKLNK
jgi:hypothetical protein